MKKRACMAIAGILALCMLCCCAAAEDVYGREDNGVYENAALGIRCELKGWQFYTKDQLSMFFTPITVMAAVKPSGFSNVNIQAQDLSRYAKAPSSDSELEEWLAMFIDPVKEEYARQGFREIQTEKSEVAAGERIFPCLKMSFRTQSEYRYQKEIMYLHNQYLVFVTVTGESFEETDALFAGFDLT